MNRTDHREQGQAVLIHARRSLGPSGATCTVTDADGDEAEQVVSATVEAAG